MKIYCDFCGSQIETTENKTCPHCGGYYSLDKELAEERARVKRLNELDEEKRRLENERMRLENANMTNSQGNNKTTAMKPGCLVMLIALSTLGIFFLLMMICIIAEGANDGMPAETTNREGSRISVSYNISMDPIDIPEIPEINVPEITINN